MRFRKLRIAWSVVWGLLCLLLVGLWTQIDRLENSIGYGISSPTPLAVLLFVALAGASWLPWRFSLRTLLIATALVAVVLGLVVWLR